MCNSGDDSREYSDELVAEGDFVEAAVSSANVAVSISLTFAQLVPLLLKNSKSTVVMLSQPLNDVM